MSLHRLLEDETFERLSHLNQSGFQHLPSPKALPSSDEDEGGHYAQLRETVDNLRSDVRERDYRIQRLANELRQARSQVLRREEELQTESQRLLKAQAKSDSLARDLLSERSKHEQYGSRESELQLRISELQVQLRDLRNLESDRANDKSAWPLREERLRSEFRARETELLEATHRERESNQRIREDMMRQKEKMYELEMTLRQRIGVERRLREQIRRDKSRKSALKMKIRTYIDNNVQQFTALRDAVARVERQSREKREREQQEPTVSLEPDLEELPLQQLLREQHGFIRTLTRKLRRTKESTRRARESLRKSKAECIELIRYNEKQDRLHQTEVRRLATKVSRLTAELQKSRYGSSSSQKRQGVFGFDDDDELGEEEEDDDEIV